MRTVLNARHDASDPSFRHIVCLERALPGLPSPLVLGCGGGGEVEDPVPFMASIPIEYPLDLWDAEVEGETLLRVQSFRDRRRG